MKGFRGLGVLGFRALGWFYGLGWFRVLFSPVAVRRFSVYRA